MIPNIPFDLFEEVINSAHSQVNQESVTWHRYVKSFDRFGEDSTQDNFDDINLLVLVHYNYYRSWPIARETPAGALDIQSITFYININYL